MVWRTSEQPDEESATGDEGRETFVPRGRQKDTHLPQTESARAFTKVDGSNVEP